jgi:hypothetical protein
MQTNKSSSSEAVVKELRVRLFDLFAEYKKEKENTFQIAANMSRQYKLMREEHLKTISGLEESIKEYKHKLELAKVATEEMKSKRNNEIERKDTEIIAQERKMDTMAKEFGQMLKQTLDKMSEKIVITSDWQGSEGNVHNHNRVGMDDGIGNIDSSGGGGKGNNNNNNNHRDRGPEVRTFENFNLGL